MIRKLGRKLLAAALGAVVLSCGEAMHPTGPGGDSDGLKVRADAVSSEGSGGPTVTTDKADYAPGDTVTIIGAGWQANESIALVLSEDPAVHGPTEWNVVADEEGSFVDRSFLIESQHIGVAFTLIATGAASADTAQGTFTDGNFTAQTNVGNMTINWKKWAGNNSCSASHSTSDTNVSIGTGGTALASGVDLGQSIELHITAVPTGTSFVNWKSGGNTRTGTTECFAGSNGSQTWTANFDVLTTTGVTADLSSPQTAGTSIVFSAAVTRNTNNSAVSAGTVTFIEGGTCAAPTTTLQGATNLPGSGIVTFTTSGLSVGAHTIRACYSGSTAGDPDLLASSGTIAFTINPAVVTPTALEITTADLNGVVGQCYGPITVESQNGGSATAVASNTQVNLSTEGPGGFFSDNACASGITSVQIAAASSSASFYYKPTGRGDGAHSLTVADNASVLTSDTEAQTVNKAATSLSLASDNDPSTFGENVKFTATVSVTSPGSGSPTGTVNFYEFTGVQSCTALGGATAFGNASLSGGTADVTLNTLSVGAHDVTACYVGDANFVASGSNTVTQDVDAIATSVALALDPSSQQYSDSSYFTATVTPYEVTTDAATVPLTGVVRFYVGASPTICSATGDPGDAGEAGSVSISDADNGVATLKYKISQPAGAYKVTACFYSTPDEFGDSGDVEDLTVTAEDVTIYDISYTPNPLFVPNAEITSFTFKVRERYPEVNTSKSAPGDIANASAGVRLKAVLAGSNIPLTCGAGTVGGTTGYDRYMAFSCSSTGLAADTYEAEITVNTTGYYAGTTSSVVQVTDPAAGFSTGGGTIVIDGEKVNFGFMAKATVNNKKTVIQGSLLVIRHGPNGEVYRAKSNVFNGYTVSGNKASFSGKAGYSEEGTSLGNFEFIGYGEDWGTPGTGDKFGLYLASAGNKVATSATGAGVAASAKLLSGGNIQVPQGKR